MQSSSILILALLGVLLSGSIVYYMVPYIHIGLFAWLWFNLWIAIYEIYIVLQRKQLTKEKCQPGFWTKDHEVTSFWKDAWNEYTCYSDTRYLDPNDFVFLIEFINALLIIMMWLLLVFHQLEWIYIVLILQAYHCAIYFISLWHSKKINNSYPWKLWIYLCISALWIILPVYLSAFAKT